MIINKELKTWINYYKSNLNNINKFIQLIKKNDPSLLTIEFTDENNITLNGLIQDDIIRVIKDNDINSKYRIFFAVLYGVNFEKYLKTYNQKLIDIFENILIELNYEIYEVEFEKIISIFINKNLIDRKNFMTLSVMRGLYLGKKYSTEEELQELKKKIKINKIKKFFIF